MRRRSIFLSVITGFIMNCFMGCFIPLDAAQNCLVQEVIAETPCFEVRAFVSGIEEVKEKLISLDAVLKGDYAFKDYIYYPKDGGFDLNKEFVRLRAYQKTNWNQKVIEVVHKLKPFSDRSGVTKFKKQFDFFEEAESLLNNYTYAFSYSRTGFEYRLGSVRIFLEDIEGLFPSIECVSPSKSEMNQLFELLVPLQILSDSVPELIHKNFS